MKRNKKKDPVSCKQADSGPFYYVYDAVLRTISQKDGAADSQNCGGRRDFVLCVPIVPASGVSPPNELCENLHEIPCRSAYGMRTEI